ncbi:MAG: N-acetylglutaminylglutamine amidotransferase [Gammaproteobacteria bacterium]|nr:N-acetylglutaminylglutamine amidotransferase [Gammaproteobacteria bacterium]
MCGICGELRFGAELPDLAALGKMMEILAQRGPDHAGNYSEGPLAFGQRRLSIIDLSPNAHQPMIDSHLGLVLVFNGTIYNYRSLQKELSGMGYTFFSTGDTEVILKAYSAWGAACVERFQGMFAFAVWDIRKHELFLCRDRLGIKPLYFTLNTRYLRFASNMQALLAAGDVDTGVDAIALHHHLTLHAVVPAPRTILKGVRKLEPGTYMILTPDGTQKIQRYWDLQAKRPPQPKADGEWIEEIHSALRMAVEKRLLAADVPVGVLLSGGLDSSLLVALLTEAGVENLLTFSVGFEDVPEEKGSEFEYSDQVAARYKTRHHRYTIPNDAVLKRLPEAIQAMAEPMVAQDAVAFYLLGEQVSRSVKVVQSGQGADEIFGGYFWYSLMDAAGGSDLERFRPHYFDRGHDEFLQTVHPDYHGEDYTARTVAALLAKPGADTFLDKVLRMDATTLIVDDPVKRVDNMTMAWGLEARVPFLDHKLVELAAQVPPALKIKENGKHLLKVIARDLLPAAIIDRPKGYFPVPALKYIRGPFLDFMRDILLSERCRQRQLFQTSYVNKLLDAPEQYMTALQGSKLWHLTLLESWFQTHIDQGA